MIKSCGRGRRTFMLADEHHHGKEEKFLFPEMVERLGRIAENLVTHGMLVEHDRGRAHVLAWDTPSHFVPFRRKSSMRSTGRRSSLKQNRREQVFRKSTTLFWMQWKRSICGTRRKLQNQGISYTNRR